MRRATSMALLSGAALTTWGRCSRWIRTATRPCSTASPRPGGDGSQPRAGLVLDAQGNLYGTTYVGGASGDGTVFKLTAATSLACQVTPPVPSIPQNGGTWGGDPYDHLKGTTIAGKGCALTSLNMALNFAGESWNPGTLNSRLDATGGYGPKGVVLWGVATAASNGGRVSNPVIFD